MDLKELVLAQKEVLHRQKGKQQHMNIPLSTGSFRRADPSS
jgi:hypothetical protein